MAGNFSLIEKMQLTMNMDTLQIVEPLNDEQRANLVHDGVELLKKSVTELDVLYFKIGMALAFIKANKLYTSYGSHIKTMSDFLREIDIGIKIGQCDHYIRIWKTFADNLKGRRISFKRLLMIHSKVTKDNMEEWLYKAENLTLKVLANEVSQITSNIGTKPSQLYGEPINFRGLRHAPVNEQGVVFLFGMVSKELNFQIECLQIAFPDCKCKYLYNPKKNLWADAMIEFEFKASNFKTHQHDPKQCDFIVCWENDWSDCPNTIKIIELNKEISKLKSQ